MREIFKGAKKVPSVIDGEIWIISRLEVESVSLKEISPKLYYKRYANKLRRYDEDRHSALPTALLAELEDRVSVLEQNMVRLLGR
ncbi:MAG TPA: hypothetical protein VG147_04195 [Solirubrobacteraceae bacterium]|jgi:hypothetical protein|nr:hypothetical protein [Solirubrobacteraceae bacterium]